MRLFDHDNSSESVPDMPPAGLFEEFFGRRNTSKPETQGSTSTSENPVVEGIKQGFDYLNKAQDGSESDPALAIWLYESVSGSELPAMVKTLLDGVMIRKDGNRVTISRDGEVRVDLNQSLLEGEIKVHSLNFGSTSFDLSGDPDSPHFKNIEGLSLAVEIGGLELTINVKDLVVSKSNDGKPVLKVEIEHPVPFMTRNALGFPARIPLTLTFGSDGMPEAMKVSDALNSAADALGYGMAGLTFGNTLRQAAREAKFAEEHGSSENLFPQLSVRHTTFEQYVRAGLHVLNTLPDGFEFNPRPLIAGYESLTGQALTGTPSELLDGVTNISKHGDRIEIRRDEETSIAVNRELLGGAFKVKSLDLGSTGFDLKRDTEVLRLTNVTGVSIRTEIAGMQRTIAINELALRRGDNGKLSLDTEVENPVPLYVRWSLGLPRRIPISLVLSDDGEVEGMNISDALNTAAEMAGSHGLMVAAKAAEIIEKHPELAERMVKNTLPVPALLLTGETPDLADLAMRANPVYATYKTADFVVEHRDEIVDVAGDLAGLAFKTSPAGMAYSLLFGD